MKDHGEKKDQEETGQETYPGCQAYAAHAAGGHGHVYRPCGRLRE